CFTISNTGDIALTHHQIDSTLRSSVGPFELQIEPGAEIISVNRPTFSHTTAVSVTDQITWTARTSDNAQGITQSASVAISVVVPAISIVKTASQSRDTCSTATVLPIPTGGTAYYCLTLSNTGDVAF